MHGRSKAMGVNAYVTLQIEPHSHLGYINLINTTIKVFRLTITVYPKITKSMHIISP